MRYERGFDSQSVFVRLINPRTRNICIIIIMYSWVPMSLWHLRVVGLGSILYYHAGDE